MTLEQIKKRKLEIRGLLQDDKAEINLDELETELRELEIEEEDLEKRSKLLELTVNANEVAVGETNEVRSIERTQNEDEFSVEGKFETTEYRKAFMDYVCNGKDTGILENRAANGHNLDTAGKAIPETVASKVIEKIELYGNLYNRSSKSNVKGGLQIPINTIVATASWVGEGTTAPNSKEGDLKGTISFLYHKLQCKVPVTLEASVISLPIFEQKISEAIAKAMVKALEYAMFNGTGVKQPLGILKDTKVTSKIDVAANGFTFENICKIISELPEEYVDEMILVINRKDYIAKLQGMTDVNGQPVARVSMGINGKLDNKTFLGFPVEYAPAHIQLKSYDVADASECFAMFVKLEDYLYNSNMQVTFRTYIDEDTDEIVKKSTLITDGKLVKTDAIVLLTKAATK